jgi:hypothetical protein
MGRSSMKSEFQFLSYKIDSLNLSILHDIGVLQFGGNYERLEWNQLISIRKPVFFPKEKIYVCAVDTEMKLISNLDSTKVNSEWLALKIGIAGLFVTQNRLEDGLEKQFVTISAPAILYPFVRAAAANILSSSGFGSVVMPLINMYKIGKEFANMEDFSIIIQE